MAGFANRVTRLMFPDLTEKGEPELFLVIRNTRTMTVDELVPGDVPLGPDGQPLDRELSAERSRELIAKLVVAGLMYDATDPGVDPKTGEPTDQRLLSFPLTPQTVRCLPIEAIQRINTEIEAAVAPKANQDTPTSMT